MTGGNLSVGSTQSADELVAEFMPFAKGLAGKIIRKYPMDYDDAVQLAYEGLIEAARRFDVSKYDPSTGTFDKHFKTFAYFRIHGTIVDEYRRNAFVSRTAYAQGERAQFTSFDKEFEGEEGTYSLQAKAPEYDLDELIAVRDALEVLNEREYEIVVGQASGITSEELSKHFGVSESRISQIYTGARAKVTQAMGE